LMQAENRKSQDFNGHALWRFEEGACAAGTLLINAALKAGANTLPRHFDQPERARAEDFRPSAIASHGVAQGPFQASAV